MLYVHTLPYTHTHTHTQVAEWIKFSLHELEIFCRKFEEEEEREKKKISAK